MSYEKYTNALTMMDNLIQHSAGISEEDKKKPDSDASKQLHTQWDDLYTFVFANFKAPVSVLPETEARCTSVNDLKIPDADKAESETELASMTEMFGLDRAELEEQLYKIPPVILEQCFPVWMARHMLYNCNVPILPTRLTTFHEFHLNYGYMIIKSADMIYHN